MGQDLREMFKNERQAKRTPMPKGHEDRFISRLETQFPKRNRSHFKWLRIAASVLVLLGVGILGYQLWTRPDAIKTTLVEKNDPPEEKKGISFGDLSPDLKRVEQYYVTNINLELSRLEISQDNKMLVDTFMHRLSELNMEYKELNDELNVIGPNDLTISALIKNLQLRLQLLQKLKGELNELKSSKNEQLQNNIL